MFLQVLILCSKYRLAPVPPPLPALVDTTETSRNLHFDFKVMVEIFITKQIWKIRACYFLFAISIINYGLSKKANFGLHIYLIRIIALFPSM